MARVTFQTLGVILLLLGLGGATTDSDKGTGVLLRDLAYVGVGAAFMLAAIASAIAERATRQPAPPAAQQAGWTPPQQYPGQYPAQAAQQPWGPPPQGGQPG